MEEIQGWKQRGIRRAGRGPSAGVVSEANRSAAVWERSGRTAPLGRPRIWGHNFFVGGEAGRRRQGTPLPSGVVAKREGVMKRDEGKMYAGNLLSGCGDSGEVVVAVGWISGSRESCRKGASENGT